MSKVIIETLREEAEKKGLNLSEKEIRAFDVYAAELKRWNSKVNLTAITKDIEIAIKHFVDSLALASYISPEDKVLDIGSGAGLPVIPLKIIKPETIMVSVDAVAKKIHFQRHIIRTLKLDNIEALHTRVEDIHKSYSNFFTVITSRAFTRLDRFVSLAAPLLAEGGVFIAMKGEQADVEITESSELLNFLGFKIINNHRYSLPQNMGERSITILKHREAA
ncbi:MAG: 16S rRNA (guanine(527)-N(7))-methyltransferase RsmG [Desulfuromonadaceae bacterium]|nr:16S rRNA (guanine(527)-N(7))-methyltransferase RsmG [Desulfuromonadaceae bacterium]MDD2854259.1 16S rRNA (guanine(527)-N(7))-methyltransferase RsmG [Desulfuromonadaceae bacterium]